MSKGTTIPASSTNAEESQRLTEGPFKALGYRPKDSAEIRLVFEVHWSWQQDLIL